MHLREKGIFVLCNVRHRSPTMFRNASLELFVAVKVRVEGILLDKSTRSLHFVRNIDNGGVWLDDTGFTNDNWDLIRIPWTNGINCGWQFDGNFQFCGEFARVTTQTIDKKKLNFLSPKKIPNLLK